ncbi:MAG: biotin/lipoyl-binding protein [Veillonella sp.]|nr:biotin/lipoyl-binding protein [Veillonella sp.]
MKTFNVTVNGKSYEVQVEEVKSNQPASKAPSAPKAATTAPAPAPVAAPTPQAAPTVAAGANTVNAPMPGKVIAVAVTVGQTVKKGDLLLTLEAMKMENEIFAQADAVVSEVLVEAGQTVPAGGPMIVLG